MRIPSTISALLLLAIPACDKAKELVQKASPSPKPVATASTSPVPLVQDLDAEGFDAFVATPGRLMVVDFHADWCGPCKVLGPVLEQVAGEFPGKVSIGKINIDHAKDLAAKNGVRGIPDVRLFRDGKEVDKFVGALDAARVRALFQKHSDDLQLAAVEESVPDAPVPAPAEPPIQPMTKDWLPPGIERR